MHLTRLNVQFTYQQKKSLDEMANKLGTTTAGVLKTALSLLKVVLRERKSHNQLAIVRDGKIVKEIIGKTLRA